MSIEIRGSENPTHPENLFYDAHCLSCNKISEENGDFLDAPYEIVGFEEELTLEEAEKKAKDHETRYSDEDHTIIIREFDTGVIWEALYPTE